MTSWQDDPLVRALTGPASPDELAGEAEALAAFRAAVPVRSRRRFAGRLGVGGSALGIAIALSGGVAAAYSSSLPAPVQSVAHDLLGGIGVPPRHHVKPKQDADGNGHHPVAAVSATPAGLSGGSPTPNPTASSAHPKPSPRHSTAPTKQPHPSTSPTPTPSPVTTPTPSPTATPTPISTIPVEAGSITISLGATTVQVGGVVTVFGQLSTPTGAPVAGQQVWLLERLVGTPGLVQVASGTTAANGSLELSSPALAHTARLRLVTGTRVRSSAITVVVLPTLQVAVQTTGSTSSIAVTTNGGDPGDTVTLEQRTRGDWLEVGTNALDGSGAANFNVLAPSKRPGHYRMILNHTQAHGQAVTRFTIAPSTAG
jgi:hypothetical protein